MRDKMLGRTVLYNREGEIKVGIIVKVWDEGKAVNLFLFDSV